MGGGSSHEVQYVPQYIYQVPPETQKQLDQQKEQINKIEEEAKKRNDPKYFKENITNAVNIFVENLPKLKLTDIIKKNPNEVHIGIVGPTSAGKTTMINTYFGLSLKTALGHCTEGCEIVHRAGNNVIWDVRGQNDDYKFYDPESLCFIKSLNKVVLLFDNDVGMISNILKVINKINSNVTIVRTKLDQYYYDNSRSIEDEKMLDKVKLQMLLDQKKEIYYISSRNMQTKTGSIYDWILLKNLLNF